jgi:hypothetical protein
MSVPLDTVLGATLAVSSLCALVSAPRDNFTKLMLVLAVALGLTLGLAPPIEAIESSVHGTLARALAMAAAVIGIVIAVRVQNRAIGALAAGSGLVLAAKATGIVGGWAVL